jgi:protein SCO1/2
LAVGAAGLICAAAVTGFVITRFTSFGRPALEGGIVESSPLAPNFRLTDQNGKLVSVEDYRGKVVALTFLYTRCPDVCPLIATTLGSVDRRLGNTQNTVEMLAVTVDPQGDTPPRIRQFTEDHGLAAATNWHYLTGAPSQLASVWQAYGGVADPSSAGKVLTPEQIEHLSLVYLIDAGGHVRVALPANFSQDDFLKDLDTLRQ